MADNASLPQAQNLEAALVEQATQLRTAQRIARLGAYVFDSASGLWTSSEMLDEIFGIADPGFERNVDGWLSLIHPADRDAMKDYFLKQVIGQGQRFDREYRIIRHSDGAERWVHGCGELTFDATGRPTQMIGTIQDCTERHNADAALRTTNARLAEMFEGAHDAIFLADIATGTIIDANRAACVLLARPKDEILGLHQTDLHPEEMRDVYRRRFAEHSQELSNLYPDTEVVASNGRRIPVEITASVVPLPDGRRAIQGIFRDLTQRKLAEAEVLKREARLASVFRAVPVGLFVVAERAFLDVNPYVTQLTGYTSAELVGKSVRLLYADEEEYERIGRDAYGAMREDGFSRIETTWRHKDGRLLDIILSAAQIVHNGAHVATTFAALDVTERRHLEAQLRQAQKMEAVGQLAGGVAHDFNNILTAMLLQLAFLKEEAKLDTEGTEAVEDLLRQSNRAADLTRQLLLFSRRQIMKKQPVDVSQITGGMLRMLHRLLGENIEITFNAAGDTPWIEGDPGMIEQVVMNLCINARDAMPGGGRLTLETSRMIFNAPAAQPAADGRVGAFLRLTITDTGSGIPDAIKPRIFEPFFTTKEVGRGTGLGLATVLGIVQQHHGWIDVQSAEGRGTTFTIDIPECAAPADHPMAPARASEKRQGSESILVVEDEASVRRLIAGLLRRSGYTVYEATDSQEALEIWETRGATLSLVISDIVMPGKISGLELCERLTTQRPDLRVIILSGYNPDIARRVERQPGRFVHMAKPCDGAAIMRMVGELLSGRN